MVSIEKQFCCFIKKIENIEQMGVQVATGNLVICRMLQRVWAWLSMPPGDAGSQTEAQPLIAGSEAIPRGGASLMSSCGFN